MNGEIKMLKSLFSLSAKSVGSIGLKIVIISAATLGGAALVSSSVFAALTATATNTSAQTVTSGTLQLTQVASGSASSAGFTSQISNIAPGDTVNRYIDLKNAGNLNAATLTLGLADATSTLLTSGSTTTSSGLQVSVNSCGSSWTSAGVCSGGSTSVLASTPASTLRGAAQTLSLPAITTAGALTFLQISLTLPLNNEVTINGTLPANTVQGLSASLTWTFTETLRTTGTTTNS